MTDDDFTTRVSGAYLQSVCHGDALAAGWWTDLTTGQDHTDDVQSGTRFGKALVAEKIALIHSEVSEALDLGGAIAEKLAYNRTRADHKPEARMAAGGKAY